MTVDLVAQDGLRPALCHAILYSYKSRDMTATRQDFSDFCAQRDAQNTIQLNIVKYCFMLCDALVDDFNRRHNSDRSYKFYFDSGRKYHKIIMETESGSRSVHAFVDKKTGDVYKAASFKAPAKGVRYNLLRIESREECLALADWSRAYLYIR